MATFKDSILLSGPDNGHSNGSFVDRYSVLNAQTTQYPSLQKLGLAEAGRVISNDRDLSRDLRCRCLSCSSAITTAQYVIDRFPWAFSVAASCRLQPTTQSKTCTTRVVSINISGLTADRYPSDFEPGIGYSSCIDHCKVSRSALHLHDEPHHPTFEMCLITSRNEEEAIPPRRVYRDRQTGAFFRDPEPRRNHASSIGARSV
jgi:hypothetical protein